MDKKTSHPDSPLNGQKTKRIEHGLNNEFVDISVRTHGIHSHKTFHDHKAVNTHCRTSYFEQRVQNSSRNDSVDQQGKGHNRTNSLEQMRQTFLSKDACRRLSAFFPMFNQSGTKQDPKRSPSCFGAGSCVGGFISANKWHDHDTESERSLIKAGALSMGDSTTQVPRRCQSGSMSCDYDSTGMGEHLGMSSSLQGEKDPNTYIQKSDDRGVQSKVNVPSCGFHTPPRAGKSRRVQCRRLKELRTVGGDLIDGSPDRDLGLISDESGEKPRLLIAISNLLERLLSQSVSTTLPEDHEDPVVAASASLFYGKCIPPISISDYIGRMYQYGQCCPASFLHAIVYMDKLVDKFGAVMSPNKFNVHRILLTGVIVGAKFLDDRVFSNAYYARVGGVSTQEMNRMEREYIQLLDHRMSVPISTLEAYCNGMERSLASMNPSSGSADSASLTTKADDADEAMSSVA